MGSLRAIGYSLGSVRRARGITQAELGESIGVPQQQIARWEAQGYANAALERVSQVADALALDCTAVPGSLSIHAAEAPTPYGQLLPAELRYVEGSLVSPVRDLGEVVARVRAHADELRARFGVTRVAAYGSFVTGEQTADSDVDLLVSVDRAIQIEMRAFREWLTRSVMGRHVDIARPEDLRWEIRDDVLREALDVWKA